MVDRCVCSNVTFKTLLAMAREFGHDFADLRERTGVAEKCGLCEPYAIEALASGEERVPVQPALAGPTPA